ncbi:hypothetical protein LTR16_002651 [Cryomyces antarcticus]|uniref:Mnd1 HTH domain-containing protein n=1 Tax=Cryomyces antarcticus TaxID=329879 RepID=A0ABR0LPD4_9PEZI|nr:hypothetical protein LTR16_002651 [Cryomyces antarcticus]
MAKSKARMKNRYLERPSTPAVQVEEQSGAQNQFLRRFATLYDVVAGRVSYHGFIPAEPQTSTYRDTAVTTTVPVPPDEALMRREGAPTPTEVDDKYSADAKLGAHQKLPDSDLLKAVHAYASDYYACATKDRGRRDWKSMEETALLAMGILLEEAAAEAPKITANPVKAASILAYFHNSGVAHSIKDLEKALPSIASVNGMQVKDYLQYLGDENKIRVEKIGSGNWYWSFLSEEKKSKEAILSRVQEENDKVAKSVEELQSGVEEASTAREDDEDMLESGGDDRATLMQRHAALTADLAALRVELASYADNDPVEVERKRAQTGEFKRGAEARTDEIYAIEGWFKEQGVDEETLTNIKRATYGGEFSEEEGGLREL